MATIDKPNFRLVTASGGEKNVITWQNDKTVNGFMRIRWRGIPDGLPQLNLTGMKANVEGFIAGLTAPVADRAVVYGQDEAGEVHILPEQHGSETVDFIENQLGGAAFEGILDTLSSLPQEAWSIARRMTNTYSGNLVRIRRVSDDVEQDFGFLANGDLDAAAVATFLGASAGAVDTIYNQISANNMIQATNADQPAYNPSGFNGKPRADPDGTDDYMTADGAASTFAGLDQPFTTFVVFQQSEVNIGVNPIIFLGRAASSSTLINFYTNVNTIRHQRADDGTGVRDQGAGGVVANTPYSGVFDYDGADSADIHLNGVQFLDGVGFNLPAAVSVDRLTVAARRRNAGPDLFNETDFSEIVVYSSFVDSTLRTTLSGDQQTYYGT